MLVQLPYGKDGVVPLEIPDENLLDVISPKEARAMENEEEVIAQALANPIGSERLSKIVSKGDKVALIITDATRPNIERKVLPHILRELKGVGVDYKDLVVVIGNGFHRPATPKEIEEKIGNLVGKVEVVNHRAEDDPMTSSGSTSLGYPLSINSAVAKAKIKIAIGPVLPHPFAGYSGGGKAISVGVASKETIASTHTPEIIDHPKTGLGMIEDNPFYWSSIEMARMVGLNFIVNGIVDEEEHLIDIVAGDVEKAHQEIITKADSLFKVNIPGLADIAIVSVGYPKDSNLYHICSEAICVVAGAAPPQPCVKKGGTIIVVSPMEEGTYNKAFYHWLSESKTPTEVVEKLKGVPITDPGQHRAYGVACILKDIEVVIAQSCLGDEVIRKVHMKPVATARKALEQALKKHGRDAKIIVLKHSHRLIPVLKS